MSRPKVHHPSVNHPFSAPPHDTLIVCESELHAVMVQKAFGIDAHYIAWGSALMGNRFNHIIVFRPHDLSVVAQKEFERFLREFLPTKLSVGHLGSIQLV